MIRSMTGYGRKETVRSDVRITVEMRAVNHRFCEVVVRLPKAWGMFEDLAKKIVTQYVQRGRVDVFVSIDRSVTNAVCFAIDWVAAEQYVQAAQQMTERFGLKESLSAKELMELPGVVHSEETLDVSVEEVEEWFATVVEEAAQDLLSMKRTEGQKLYQDLTQRLALISEWSNQIRQLAPLAGEEYRKRLDQRMADLADEFSFELDQQRVAQEVVLYVDRSDISEETTRLDSHCNQFTEQLTKDEPVGRKLDFLLQELNREANTIASKANHLPIQQLAVNIKTELEKLREQVQNIE